MSTKTHQKNTARLSKHQLATFNEIGKALTSTLDITEILGIVMDKVGDLLKPRNWSLLLIDERTKCLKFEIAVGKGAEKLKGITLAPGEGIAGWVAREMRPLLVPDVSKDPRFSKKADRKLKFKTQSIICVPLVSRDSCLGVIELINEVKEEGDFTDTDLMILTTVADYTAIAIENAILFKRVQELTITDDVTGLYNSRFLHRRLDYELERARRFKHALSMVFIDIDYFKDVNDRHGHLCGSKLLKEMAELMQRMTRSVDMLCRYGGDEFVILMPQTSKKSAAIAAEKMRKAIKQNVFLKEDGVNARLTASFGVASYPGDVDNKTDLIRLADQAMYVVKNRKRDGVALA